MNALEIVSDIGFFAAFICLAASRWDCEPVFRWLYVVGIAFNACAIAVNVYTAANGRFIHEHHEQRTRVTVSNAATVRLSVEPK